MIAAARRQNYGAAAGPRPLRLSCMVDFCVYLFYRVASALLTALPLRLVFALGEVLGFCTDRHYVEWWVTVHHDNSFRSEDFESPEETEERFKKK